MRPQDRIAVPLWILGWALISIAVGAESLVAPNGPPPHPARVILQDGQLFLERVMYKQVREVKSREVTVNGSKVQEKYTVTHIVGEHFVQPFPKGSFLVFTVGGKKQLNDQEVSAALAKETEVLVSPAGKILDARYRPLFNPAALIVYIKPEQMMGMTPPAPGGAPAMPAPEFSKKDPPQSLEPGIAFLSKVGDKLVLVEFDWDVVNEYKTVPNQPGQPARTPTSSPIMHWVPAPRERSFSRSELTTHNLSGAQSPGALNSLSNQPIPVFLENPTDKIDPARYKLCQPNSIIVRANFPPPEFESKYTAPPVPTECFAQVEAGRLIVRRPVWEKVYVKEPITVMENGKPVAKEIEKMVVKTKFVAQDYAINVVRASDAAGRALPAETLATRLAKEIPVLVAAGGKPVDPAYRERMKAEAVILMLPEIQAPSPVIAPHTYRSPLSVRPWTFVAQAVEPPVTNAAPARSPAPRFVRVQALGDKLVLNEPITVVGFAAPAAPGSPPTESPVRAFAHWKSQVISAEHFKVFEIDGRHMDPAIFKQGATRPLITLFSDLGGIDPVWLNIYKPGSLIVYVKPDVMHGGYGPAS